MRQPATVWDSIKGVFTDFNYTFIPLALLFCLLVYFVFKTLAENNAKKLIPIYILVLLAMGAVAAFSEDFGTDTYFLFVLLFSIFFLSLFTMEIKRNLWHAGKRTAKTVSDSPARTSQVAAKADEYIAGISKAVQSLSKNNIGALIVLSNGNLPKDIIESGVVLNAKISNQLIEGIFIPKAPLHDGAMIIYGDKIQAAGCFLPLTQRDFPKDYGTRHRAGIGITEVADVATIIVSEETGIVSYVKRGEITRYVDSEGLKRFLKEYYWKEFNAEGRKA